jgi:hypothetical protein
MKDSADAHPEQLFRDSTMCPWSEFRHGFEGKTRHPAKCDRDKVKASNVLAFNVGKVCAVQVRESRKIEAKVKLTHREDCID